MSRDMHFWEYTIFGDFLHNPTSTFSHIRYVSYRPEFENIDPVVKQNE